MTFELVTGYNSEISQMTPLDLLMRMRKKRSALELIPSSKKNRRVEVELYTKSKKYTTISIR
jgi:hypothetical protein